MRFRFRVVFRLAVAVVVAASVLAFAGPAVALTVPQTMADRQPVQAGPVEPGFPIDHLGVLWDVPDHVHDAHGHDDAGPEPHGAVRFRTDGGWGPWIRLIEDGAEGEGQWASGLVPGGDADAYQVRGIPDDAGSPRVVAINTTDGPEVAVGEARGDAAHALESTMCKSRAEWGADESLRDDSDGNEIWPPAFYPVQTVTVHHTATDNDDPDPEATVRAIYRYHAIDRGWGDIGYQYLVDEQGIVYEGRWSGTESTPCGGGGDGSDFGHETTDLDGDGVVDEMVTGAHVGGSNSGNMGVALLGEFTDHPRFGGDPKAAAVGSLEDVLVELGLRHGLDPTATIEYVNPVNGERHIVDTIPGHRDWSSTECPGERLYAQLPDIRQRVKEAMADDGSGGDTDDTAPVVAITDPVDGSTVGSTISITADASDDVGVTKVAFSVDDVLIETDSDGGDGWSVSWDTTTVADGAHTVSATATDTAGQTATHSVGVTVDNEPDASLAVTGTDRDTDNPLVVASDQPMTVYGTGFVEGAAVTLENGKGHTPTVTSVVLTDTGDLEATVTVDGKGPSASWDVRITLPDGATASCTGCVYVDR